MTFIPDRKSRETLALLPIGSGIEDKLIWPQISGGPNPQRHNGRQRHVPPAASVAEY
jgi:hypothetical protein